MDWDLTPWKADLRATVQHLTSLRHANPVLRPLRFYDRHEDDPHPALQRSDFAWFTAAGDPESDDWWEDPHTRVLQFMRSLPEEGIADALLIINGTTEGHQVTIPVDEGKPWHLAWDSAWETPVGAPVETALPGGAQSLAPSSIRLYLTDPDA